jgi:nicotinamidase-related amidase
MPLSQLDANAALIVVDLQKGIVALPTVHDTVDIVKRSASLARAFRASGLPSDPAFFEFVPEIEQAPSDHIVEKKRWGAFHGTDLDSWLRGKGVEQVVIVGVATSIGVESTARFASEHGYNVVIVPDAMTDMVGSAHDNSVNTIFPRLAETTTTADLLQAIG